MLLPTVLFTLLLATGPSLRAEPAGDGLPPVSASLPPADRIKLGKWRTKIARAETIFEDNHQKFVAKYGTEISNDDPSLAAARTERDALQAEGNRIDTETDKFKEALGLAVKIQDASRQIAEMGEQLRGWGFKQREAELVRYGGLAGQARDRLIAQLTLRVQGLATSKAEALMQETFLEKIRTMKRKEVNRLAEALGRAGLKDHDLQLWLRDFSEKAPRAVLVKGAKDAITCLKYEENLFKLAETDTDTMAGRQEAVLTLASMLIDHKYLAELKAVAGGIYDVGEAGVTLYILGEGVDHLNDVTEQQLIAQKTVVGRMKALVDQRTSDKARYAGLVP